MKIKKGQASLTITWFVALLVISLVMILFMIASVSIAGRRTITFDRRGFGGYEYDFGDNKAQRVLIGILNSEIEGDKVRHLIFSEERPIEEILGIMKKYCHVSSLAVLYKNILFNVDKNYPAANGEFSSRILFFNSYEGRSVNISYSQSRKC